MTPTDPSPKPPADSYLIRHREPFWAYKKGQRSGTAHVNYVRKNGRRSLRLHIQIKQRGNWKQTIDQVSVLIPIPLMDRMMRRIRKDGPINHRDKITFEMKRFRRAPP